MSLLFLFGTPVASPGHVIAGVRSNYVSCSFGLVGYGPISMQAPMCQWLITCVLRCANELNQLLMKELSISRLGQRWCSLPSTSHPHPLHPVSLSYLDLQCLTSSPRSCFILVGDCYVEQKPTFSPLSSVIFYYNERFPVFYTFALQTWFNLLFSAVFSATPC